MIADPSLRIETPPLLSWLQAAWARAAAVRAVEVEGATVRYRDWGAPIHGGPDGLLFMHGFLAHACWWDHIAPHFADRHHVIAPDFTGMGDSDRRPAYSRLQYAREIIAAIRDAGLRRPTIVAHSFGAVSSLNAARLAPDLIARVIVIDAHVFPPPREEEAPVRTVMPEKRYATRTEAMARYRLTPPGAWPVAPVLDYVARHSLRETPDGWTWKFDPRIVASVHEDELRDAVRGLTTPVDYIRAGNSELIDDAAMARFRAALPQCGEPVTVPLSHHHIMIEQPVALVTALAGLLAHDR